MQLVARQIVVSAGAVYKCTRNVHTHTRNTYTTLKKYIKMSVKKNTNNPDATDRLGGYVLTK